MSNYQIKRNSIISIEYGADTYVLDALGSFTYSQTYSRSVKTRRTLHAKTPRPLTQISGVSAGSCSLDVMCTDNGVEGILYELLGLDFLMGAWELPQVLPTQPKYFNMYIQNNNEVIMLEKCALTMLDTMLNKLSVQQFSVALGFSKLQKVDSAPEPTKFQGAIPEGSNSLYIDLDAPMTNFTEMKGVTSATISLQQAITWRADRSLHGLGGLYTPTVAIVSDMPFSMIISTYDRLDQVLPDISESTNIRIKCGVFNLTISDVFMTKRLEVADVLSLQYDISLTETSGVAVRYGE